MMIGKQYETSVAHAIYCYLHFHFKFRFQTAQDDMVIQIKEEETKIPVNDIKIIKCVRTKVIWTPSNIVCKRFNVNPPRAEYVFLTYIV